MHRKPEAVIPRPVRAAVGRLVGAVDLLIDFATLGEYGLERPEFATGDLDPRSKP